MTENRLEVIRRDFSRNTSCHGVSQLYSSKSKLQRAFWCLLVLVVLGMLGSQLSQRMRDYLSHKTTTSISEKYTEFLEMPAITICNFNSYFGIESAPEREAISELAKAKSDVEKDAINYDAVEFFNSVYNGSIRKYTIDKGWQMNNSLLWCFYGTRPCNAVDFKYTISDLGKCWTYENPVPVRRAGSRQGIYMIFDVKQDEYTETYMHGHWEAGIKIQVHPRYDVPEVDQFGMAVPEKIMRHPWGECDPNNEKLDHFTTYSGANCFSECFRASLEGFIFINRNALELAHAYPSAGWLRQQLTPTKCGCRPPCTSKRYDSKISYGVLPNLPIREAIQRLRDNASVTYLTNNLVGITVYYEKLSYTLQEENEAIPWSALLSDLGGQLGLWIGISVVTIFEFVQLLVFHLKELYKKCKEKTFRST